MDSNLVIGLALVAAGVAIGIGFNVLVGRTQARIEAARSWTTVTATIQEAKLSRVGKTSFAPKITYAYSVGGASYTGHRLQFGGVAMTRLEAEEVLTAYPVGSSTDVRYDPTRHDFAVLRLDADTKAFKIAAIGIGLAFAVAGLVVAFAS